MTSHPASQTLGKRQPQFRRPGLPPRGERAHGLGTPAAFLSTRDPPGVRASAGARRGGLGVSRHLGSGRRGAEGAGRMDEEEKGMLGGQEEGEERDRAATRQSAMEGPKVGRRGGVGCGGQGLAPAETRQVLDLAWGLLAGGRSGGLGGPCAECWGSAGGAGVSRHRARCCGLEVRRTVPWGPGGGAGAGSSELAEGGRAFGRAARRVVVLQRRYSSPPGPSARAGGRGSGRGDLGGGGDRSAPRWVRPGGAGQAGQGAGRAGRAAPPPFTAPGGGAGRAGGRERSPAHGVAASGGRGRDPRAPWGQLAAQQRVGGRASPAGPRASVRLGRELEIRGWPAGAAHRLSVDL